MIELKILLLALFSIFAAMFGLYKIGARAGEKSIELRNKQHVIKTMEKAQNVKNDIDSISSGIVKQRLRDNWTK